MRCGIGCRRNASSISSSSTGRSGGKSTDEGVKERLLGNHSRLKGQGDIINGIKGNAIRTAGLLREANMEQR